MGWLFTGYKKREMDVQVQALVFQRANSSTHRINHYPVDTLFFALLAFISPVASSIIHPLNIRAQMF